MSFLSEKDIEEIYKHATQDYPNECCGVVVGLPGDDNSKNVVNRCRNIQNQMHEEDPDLYSRTAEVGYIIDPKDLYRILNDAEEKGLTIKVIYHSHPDHEAYFSGTDQRDALFGDEPAYPGTYYMVVSVFKGKVKNHLFFGWDEKQERFVQLRE